MLSKKSADKFSRYVDPTGELPNQELKLAKWYLKHKILLGQIGVDLLVAFIVLARPIRIALLWAAVWGFWTALLRPIAGEPVWDFVERWANWGAPLALLMLRGRFPRTLKELFS